MKDKVLKDIIEYAIKRLNNSYGFCGVAESEEMAILNSEDRKGNGIKITIKLTPE